ncbi:MAG: hypothetical protein HYS44_02655 [Candidatus Niyogibacteria bacterium]|nr:hypothetical protein [Candidatus Niyogibacteria bacterium]
MIVSVLQYPQFIFLEISMKKLNAIRDFLWVLQAFLRGKVLRQKAYWPLDNVLRPPVPTTVRRISMLMRWWGYRLPTLDEAKALVERKEKHGYRVDVDYFDMVGLAIDRYWNDVRRELFGDSDRQGHRDNGLSF